MQRRRRRARKGEQPVVYTDGTRMVISLDGGYGLDQDGRSIHQSHPLRREKLRFSVTKSGNLKFARKTKTYLQYEKREKLDEEGNKIPNERRQNELERWGHSYQPEFEVESVPMEEPEVRLEYGVDSDWWRRNAYTKVRF